MAPRVVEEVASLVGKRWLSGTEFESRPYLLLPDDGDERIACLGTVGDTVIVGVTHPHR